MNENYHGEMSRRLAVILSVSYVVAAFAFDGMVTALGMVTYLLVPFACVWWPEGIGSHVSVTSGFTRESPEILVSAMGWVLLVLPIGVLLLWSC